MEPFDSKKIDSLANSPSIKKANMRKWMKDFLKNNEDVTSILSFTNNEALYMLEEKMQLDEKKVNLSRIIAGGKNKFYTNTTTKEYFKQVEIGELLRVEMKPFDWKITQETKTIGKYICYKATATKETENSRGLHKKTTTAWFTPTIPVNFGPKEYFGLPGLILEIIEDKKSIKATKITLNTTEKITIKRPTKGKKMTQEEYDEMGRDFFKNLDRRRN
ncbi:hypothetical protein LPB136_12120 [Tenacibaculum todarodis]|uniref:GLPGLI family protein n=1 Tax=Tenacibaculum todarodis TaxID=1850252 RepID=A0A1L3JN28_9FLAO|nr:hypothetical protein LPB136_12120 [Tenacibaculum todarodis]